MRNGFETFTAGIGCPVVRSDERASLPSGFRRHGLSAPASTRLGARARIGEHRFVDVTNDAVIRQPIETFERIYDFLGMSLTPGLRGELENYTRDNAPGHFGEHRYTPEEFGLSGGAIRTAFSHYIERFAL